MNHDQALRLTRRIAIVEWIAEARTRHVSPALMLPLFDKWWSAVVKHVSRVQGDHK